ncbi:DNA polymerase III subunit alpha [Sphingobium limneticum]|jgi:error-prone DNA polymerase|uniref:error-prone DNA polymerase n=1 Tax=Sphingobium limneticum TaxID=1007511 RepID=UPI00123CC127|nr:error-prone DNA polymerase [Sphingobium limneticum]KAA9011212.1 DNA polymerase III subunit alpha [Sphingobium limneticum]
MNGDAYVELQVTTHFSFLRGVSSPDELFAQAAWLKIPALGVVDRNSVAGIVRAWEAAKETGVRLIPGCRLDLACGTSLLVYPTDKAAWSRLTRLLSIGKARAGKGACDLHWDDVEQWQEGLIAILVPDLPDDTNAQALRRLSGIFGERAYLGLSLRRRPDDAIRIHSLDGQARAHHVRSVVLGDILYHSNDRELLQDVVTAIRHHCTVDALGFRRERYADRHLKSGAEMARRFAAYPDALAASADIARACTFDLGQLRYQYPQEASPGETPQQLLERLTGVASARMFPDGVPKAYADQLAHELGLIEKLSYAPYFLTVNSIVAEARRRGILCQGRGSAANSCVCFVLGITSIDPIKHELLFERFVSGERKEPPDIDVDFEHERREEIIQWIYETYGRTRAALTAVVTRYRARGAVREVGKALGLPEDMTGALAGLVWGWSLEGVRDDQASELNLDTSDPRLALTLELSRELIGTPRHLSQHPGGFVLTSDRLDELVPIEPAAMEDRQVIEWDKDDIDALKFMKVDILGLGMLGCMRRAFALLAEHRGIAMTMASPTLQRDDPAVFAMIQRADTLGVFQIESRAQMSMLPRIKPEKFYDLVIEVAIVRPGPIQGDMVHPYLRRREGKEKPEYPREELRAVLQKTLGVPLFQEQAMKVAIVGAGFTAAEADQLRRAMATFKFTGGVSHFYDKLVEGMVGRGYPRDFAERTFKQIEGFGSYGFPESHAASFAKIAYASSWMKCHHPDIFCAALLNAQPMGFYAPAQIVRDARAHGVEVRPPCINRSRWDCTLEPTRGRYLAVRLGLRMARGLSNLHAAMIVSARGDEQFNSVEGVWRRAGVPPAAIERLADADAFHALAHDRRQALWQVKGLGDKPLPLFAAADAREGRSGPEGDEPMVTLEPLSEGREVVEDYRTIQLSLRAHPLAFLREDLRRRGVKSAAELDQVKDGRHVEVAGVILVRQKPGSAKGVLFITIEDETGIANGILWPDRFEAQRRTVLASAMVGLRGRLQREGIVTHIIIDRVIDYTPLLRSIGDAIPSAATWYASDGKADLPKGAAPDDTPRLRLQSRNFH